MRKRLVRTEAFRAEPATLYVVATPIGNLRDVTLRALDILRSVDVILAEDTRVTATLLARYGIATRPRALHRHNEAREVERTRARYRGGTQRRAGQRCRNAGDQRSGRAARARDRTRTAIASCRFPARARSRPPFPAAGLDAESLRVHRLPAARRRRRGARMLATFAPLPAALVFYEAPHRDRRDARASLRTRSTGAGCSPSRAS